MKSFKVNLEKLTLDNSNFRNVIFTAPHSQLVLMSLKPNEEIGFEVHDTNDQFFRFEAGHGKVIVENEEFVVEAGDCVVVPAYTRHNIINVDNEFHLKFYTIYSPAHHPDGVVHRTKEEALMAE